MNKKHIEPSNSTFSVWKGEGTKEGDQEEKQEKGKEEEKGVGNEEETMENGDKGGKKEYQLE